MGLSALVTRRYLRLAALGTKMYLRLAALVTEMYQGLAALVTSRYCGAVSPSYKKVPEACSLWYKNVPRAGSPGYLKGPRAGSPGHIFVPRAASPGYIGLADYRLRKLNDHIFQSDEPWMVNSHSFIMGLIGQFINFLVIIGRKLMEAFISKVLAKINLILIYLTIVQIFVV